MSFEVTSNAGKSRDGRSRDWKARYEIDGRQIVSATDILGTMGIRGSEYRQIPAAVLEKATRRGNQVHAWIEANLLGNELPWVDPKFLPWIQSWEQWAADHRPRPIEVEYQCHFKNGPYEYCGTLDLYCELRGGRLAIIDWKNRAAAPNGTDRLQTIAYKRALVVAGKGDPDAERMCVQLSEKGYKNHKHATMLDNSDWNCFYGLLMAWHWRVANGWKPKTLF